MQRGFWGWTSLLWVERNREQDGIDPSGMNFVGGGAGVVEGMHEAPKLGTQVDKFRGWSGTTSSTKTSPIDSVALIAFFGKHGFARVNKK